MPLPPLTNPAASYPTPFPPLHFAPLITPRAHGRRVWDTQYLYDVYTGREENSTAHIYSWLAYLAIQYQPREIGVSRDTIIFCVLSSASGAVLSYSCLLPHDRRMTVASSSRRPPLSRARTSWRPA